MRLIFFLSDSWHNETSSSPPPKKKSLDDYNYMRV